MSIKFNDTTNLNGLVQLFEDEVGYNPGDVSGNTVRLKKFTARVNAALDRYFAIAIQASGKWQLDDKNHNDYPFITTDLVAGQRDYSYSTDGSGNIVLDIYKVMVKDEAGIYHEIYPEDQQSNGSESFYDGQDLTGVPSRYDKTGNGIFLDFIPSYNSTAGLKVFINRESSYFVYTDTTKTPGYPYHQEYFYLKPAYEQARIKGHDNYSNLEKEILKLEGNPLTGQVGLIAKAYGNRSKDEVDFLSPEAVDSI